MEPRSLTVMTMLLDLKSAATSLLGKKHRNPALLNLFIFIDICASLSSDGQKTNRKVFERYLADFSVLSKWERFSTYELWAARSSLVHAYSPFGHHTNKVDSEVRPIFYYSWPEKSSEVEEALRGRGYSNFLLIDINEIKNIAIDTFNEFYRRVDESPEFERLFLSNAKHILPSLHHMRLEDELTAIQQAESPSV